MHQISFNPTYCTEGFQLITPHWGLSADYCLYERKPGHSYFRGVVGLPFKGSYEQWQASAQPTGAGDILLFISESEAAKRDAGNTFSWIEYDTRTGVFNPCVRCAQPAVEEAIGETAPEPTLTKAVLRVSDESDGYADIECTMSDGQKGALVRVDADFPELASKVAELLSRGKTPDEISALAFGYREVICSTFKSAEAVMAVDAYISLLLETIEYGDSK